nr:hypothetical protein [Saprospiraceae bacterium]
MLRYPFILLLALFGVLNLSTGFGQANTSYLSEIDRAWQMGTCNCYVFSVSIWEYHTEGDKTTSNKIQDLQFINGSECKDLKEPGSYNHRELPMELQKLDLNQSMTLKEADVEMLVRLEEFNEAHLLENTFTKKYKSIAIRTEVLQSTEQKEKKTILVTLLSNSPNDKGELPVADMFLYPLNGNSAQ